MALHVVAHSLTDYSALLERQRQPAAAPTDAILERGRQAFIEQRCSVCHTIRGVAGGSGLGPDLTHIGSRLHIAADIGGETLHDLATYLEHVK